MEPYRDLTSGAVVTRNGSQGSESAELKSVVRREFRLIQCDYSQIMDSEMGTPEKRPTTELFKPGTRVKVEVHISDPPVMLHTSVRSCDIQMIELDAPVVKGTRLGVLPQTHVTVTETSPTGLILIDTNVLQVNTKPLPVWVLHMPGLEDIRHIQRRREVRYEVDLHLRWKRREETNWPDQQLLHMINVNTFGAFVAIQSDLEVGSEIVVDLTPLIQIGGNPLANYRITPRSKIIRRAKEQSMNQGYGVTFENLERLEKGFLLEGIRRLKSRMV